jgi:signal transduction histidine kinase
MEIALEPSQIPHSLLVTVPHTLLWHNGALILATVIVTALAFGSSRREAALASARGDFIAGVSHDLRMPLAQILLASETMTLREDLDSGERSTLAHSIVRESKRLIGLVENLLLFSRSGAAELRPRRDVVPVRPLLEESVEAVQLAAQDAGQSVEIHADASLALIGEARLLRQALVNLVDNAIKYGPRGQQIIITAATEGAIVRISVDDQGPGIPVAERERVFEPYERLMRDQSSERTGTGLGLAVVSYIVRASGGVVTIADAPAGGARVQLELPAA